MNDVINNPPSTYPSSSTSSYTPRSQSLSSHSISPASSAILLEQPVRASSISSLAIPTGTETPTPATTVVRSFTVKSGKRLSRKLPPAWTESLENLSIQSHSSSSSSEQSHSNQIIDKNFEYNFDTGISPLSKTITLPLLQEEEPTSSSFKMGLTNSGGSNRNSLITIDSNNNNTQFQSRPYVLDVDMTGIGLSSNAKMAPIQLQMPISSGSSSRTIRNTNTIPEEPSYEVHEVATSSRSKQKQSFNGVSSSSSSSRLYSHFPSISSTSSSSTSLSVNSLSMGFLKSSSKSSSSRSDILLTPKQHTSRLHRSSLDSVRCSTSSRGACGPQASTWSLFDEIQMEDNLSSAKSPTSLSARRKVKKETRQEKKERIQMEKEVFDEDTPPSQKMLFEASLLEVVDEHGQRVRFGDLVRNRKTIVVFIRHWYCPLCAQYMNSILAEVSLDALEEANVDLIIIGNGSDKMLNGYRNKAFKCPFKMYTDPTLALYRAMGLTRQTGDGGDEEDKGDYLVQSAMASTVQTIKRATKMPLKNPGHFTQLGGEFIFDGTLNLIYTHRMVNTRSHKPIRDICEKAGVRLEFIHYEPGPPPPPVHRHSFINPAAISNENGEVDYSIPEEEEDQFSRNYSMDNANHNMEIDSWQVDRDQTISRMKALKAARRGGPTKLSETRLRVVDNVKIVGQDVDEEEVVLGFSALGIAH
ncbi:uncharacterized protein L201_004463 [Kwoniella dendrophila CBS 6074]|uniref:Thioredoxin domain-containing protein n=1 Tax=Kwoniella dendrophila CBS 6074 TaxID=1295534 RepID=A0AAX4JXC3_9TREE